MKFAQTKCLFLSMTLIGTEIAKNRFMQFWKTNLLIIMLVIPIGVQAQFSAEKADSTYLIQEGIASYYGKKFHDRKTANGERFHMDSLTAAHKSLPFGTILKVSSIKTGKSVFVRINDRLPQSSTRIIDLSRGAAKAIDMITMGITKVRLEVPEQSAVISLQNYYKEKKPTDIRLRVYERSFMYSKPNITINDNYLDLRNLTLATNPLLIRKPKLNLLADQ
jgi:rare lipoprotein A